MTPSSPEADEKAAAAARVRGPAKAHSVGSGSGLFAALETAQAAAAPQPGALAREEDRRLRGRVIGRRFANTAVGLFVLTVMAGVIVLPFVYMLTLSLKGPSEIGSKSGVMPVYLAEMLRPGGTRDLWVIIPATEMDTAALADQSTATVKLLPSEGGAAGASVVATRLALEKTRLEGDLVTAIFRISEEENPGIALPRVATACEVVLPPKTGKTPLPGLAATAAPREWGQVAGRLFANYAGLLRLDVLAHGNWLEWISRGYPRWYLNSLFVALTTLVLGVFFDSLAAFAFAKYQFPGKQGLFAVLLATVMIPYPVTLVPMFFIFAKLGFYNTYAALIIPGLVSAFGIFLIRQYMLGIPDDLLHAARVDGAGDFRLYWHIALPTARPVLAALAVFRFIHQWNSYLFPLVLTNRETMKTIQLGLSSMEDFHGTVDYGVQMAGATLAVIPVLCVYAFLQRHFIAGITMGSVKD